MKQVFAILFLIFPLLAFAQADSNLWIPAPPANYSFIKYDDNNIAKAAKLDSFFFRLQQLKQGHHGRVNIIHIGDSHLQADGITSVLRNGFQEFFGDAGRGLVFPYQVANTNGPHDIASSAHGSWKSNKITNQSSTLQTGVSGYGIHAGAKDATVNIKLKETDGRQEHFNQMTFFLSDANAAYSIADSSIAVPLNFQTHTGADIASITSDSMLTGLSLATDASLMPDDYSFYGVSLEKKDSSGVLYHTIGVNGVRMDQYLQNDLFWKQLGALKGDLFIISLGTNEAQNPHINEVALIAICDSFVKQIHKTAPRAAILFTTPAGSYYRMKKPNASLENVTEAFKKYCDLKSIPYWDLYHITGGKTGAVAFKKHDLLSHDLVHYNAQGYQLQGQLLLSAFARVYNAYTRTHVFKAIPVTAAVPDKIRTTKKPPSPPQSSPLKLLPSSHSIPDQVPAVRDTIIHEHKSNIQVNYSN